MKNSQAERDYLRQKVLEILQESGNALKQLEIEINDQKRNKKSDSIGSKNGHDIDLDNPKGDGGYDSDTEKAICCQWCCLGIKFG